MRWMKPGRDEEIADDLAAMRRYARSLTRDDQDADDVVQTALVRAMERHRTFRPDRDRRRWLLAIVHNVFISGRRRLAAEGRRNARFADTLIGHVEPEQDQRARLNQVARAFAELSDHHRAVMHLIIIEGMSYQEAAKVLDVPIGTVMSRLARARSALRAMEAGLKKEEQPARLRLVGKEDD